MRLNSSSVAPALLNNSLTPRPVVTLDPLNSPHPIPWNWVLATQNTEIDQPLTRYYRSPSLRSPNGQYAAYSRIQFHVQPDFTASRVSSLLFVENLSDGGLQTINATSPFAEAVLPNADVPPPGAIAMLIPIAWSADSTQVLAREFESLFGSDIASDYAVIWDCDRRQSWTVAPVGMQYNHAVLLGWSQHYPQEVLFRLLLAEQLPLIVRVDCMGQTQRAYQDQAQVYGEVINHLWAGPQSTR